MTEKKQQNLVPFSEFPAEKKREIQRKGGRKSGEVRRKKKEVKDLLEIVNDEPLPENMALTVKEILNVQDPTYRHVLIAGMYSQMLKGDVRAMELYLKIIGEYPKDGLLSEKSLTVIWNEKRYETDEETE